MGSDEGSGCAERQEKAATAIRLFQPTWVIPPTLLGLALELLAVIEYCHLMPRPLLWQPGDIQPPCRWKNVTNLASSKWSWALGLLLVLLLTGCFSRTASVTDAPPTADVQTQTQDTATVAESDAAPADTETPADGGVPEFKLVSSEITVPATVRLSDAAVEIVKLANAGLDESVMLAFITNSLLVFNLGPEEIIYLTDIGVGAGIIKAMLVHDHNNPDVSLVAGTEPQPPMSQTMIPIAESASPEPPISYVPPPAEFDYANYSPEPPVQEVSAPEPDFYDALAPYGNWVDVEGYGVCWQPTVACNAGWQPYVDRGRWAYTDCGWYWSSEYSWGWAPFHYGRWFQHPTLHWCWVPDRTWGPSWVCWRYNDNYCGWAPLPPAAQFTTAGLCFKGQPAPADCQFGLASSAFHFVPGTRIRDSQLARCVLRPTESARVFTQTTPSTGIRRHHETVVNQGLPANRGGTATPVIALRPRHVETLYGNRERFEANGSTLTIPQSSALAPVVPASVASGPVGETRHQAAPAAVNNPMPRQNPRNALAQQPPISQPVRHMNGSTPGPIQLASAAPSTGSPAVPTAPNRPAPRSSLVVIGHKGASSGSSHPYVYYSSPPPQPQPAPTTYSGPVSPAPREASSQPVSHFTPGSTIPVSSHAQWWVPSQPSAQPIAQEPPRRHDRAEAFNAAVIPTSYPAAVQHTEPPEQHSAPVHQPQNDPAPVSRHEHAAPEPQHSDHAAPQTPQPHSHETSSSSSQDSSASHSSSTSSGRH